MQTGGNYPRIGQEGGGADKNWGTREEFSFFKEPMGMNKPKFDLKQ